MDDYLNLILNWFNSLDINPDVDKLKRQLSIISNWFKKGCKGYLEAITGFGKTYVAIIAIYRLNLKYEDATINVIVPSTKLYDDWIEHISFFRLKNTKVFVVNSYVQKYLETKQRYNCTLLVCDEVHNYLSENAQIFNQTIKCTDYEMFLGLSATLDDKEKNELHRLGIPCIDTVTMSEGRRFNYISDYVIYNLGLEMNGDQLDYYNRLNDIHNSNFGKFLHFNDSELNFELIRACSAGNDKVAKVGREFKTGKEWRLWYAEEHGWDGSDEHDFHPNKITKYANQWSWAMRTRKDFLYNYEGKLNVTKQIIEKLNVPTITFSQTIDFANKLVEILGDKARAYHSELESETIEYEETVFRKTLTSAKSYRIKTGGVITPNIEQKGYNITFKKQKRIGVNKVKEGILKGFPTKYNTLCTAKALDEGFNVEGIQCAITCSATSKRRQTVQRNGRALRFIKGKKAILVNLYVKNTQEETWLNNRQRGETNVVWIDSVDDIKL
jgi:superfamily II DNA or RNA helicase